VAIIPFAKSVSRPAEKTGKREERSAPERKTKRLPRRRKRRASDHNKGGGKGEIWKKKKEACRPSSFPGKKKERTIGSRGNGQEGKKKGLSLFFERRVVDFLKRVTRVKKRKGPASPIPVRKKKKKKEGLVCTLMKKRAEFAGKGKKGQGRAPAPSWQSR